MNKPIRILHILQRMEAGGTQAFLMNIYRNIDRSKVQFDFLVEYNEKQFYDDEIKLLGGKIFYTSFREDFNIFKFNEYLNSFFQSHPEYKIIHVHTYSIGYFCLKAAKKAGVTVRVAHSHSNETVHDYKYLPKLLMQRVYTKYATNLFACSNDAGKYLFKHRKFEVVRNAIDSRKFKFNACKRNNIRKELNLDNKFVVGHVGRFHKSKNHMFLIDVFKEIKKYNNNSVLLLVGSGPEEQRIKEKVEKLNLSDSVIFLSNRSDMDYIYQAMDVFVFPSLFEGLGIVTIEAQCSGIPTLCSERIPADVNITPLYNELSLDLSPNYWAKCAIQISKDSYAHHDMQKLVIDSGYDIVEVSTAMQNFYIKSYIESTL
ncbi:glycosyltransferase family 1 protein [Companilactobacillus insicii]|uniref:glycosyltransferase family 1 protein n=1 Tax=Companilactobacillus insicii TaxID=1732567 RepID=UPI0013DD9DB2|nr:glycosyltransferase family 1 protein [Companilactobacillus insicii]